MMKEVEEEGAAAAAVKAGIARVPAAPAARSLLVMW